ncbi:hypothetical protein Taro_010762, partial [Colocasia esculenta]|nr:hypothetical protein [Colocasia esculenta]
TTIVDVLDVTLLPYESSQRQIHLVQLAVVVVVVVVEVAAMMVRYCTYRATENAARSIHANIAIHMERRGASPHTSRYTSAAANTTDGVTAAPTTHHHHHLLFSFFFFFPFFVFFFLLLLQETLVQVFLALPIPCWVDFPLVTVVDPASPASSPPRVKERMFTEGLDETALNWGTDVGRQSRSPLQEKTLMSSSLPDPQLLCNNSNFLSPNSLPPLKFYSGLLGSHPTISVDLEDDRESIGSAPDGINFSYSDTVEEEGLESSDSDLFARPASCDEEVKSYATSGEEAAAGLGSTCRPVLVRGLSKENLKVEVPKIGRRDTVGELGYNDSVSWSHLHSQDQSGILPPRGPHTHEPVTPYQDMGTPSAPPIMENGREVRFSGGGGEEITSSVDGSCWMPCENETQTCYVARAAQSNVDMQTSNDGEESVGRKNVSSETKAQPRSTGELPFSNLASYHNSGQSAWQTFVAYDACFRLCLNAWARNCMEAPEFLQDECMVLRNAFGLQRYLLQPQGQVSNGKPLENPEETGTVREKKVVEKIKVEVRKIRIITQRKLRSTFSQRTLYMKAGAEYARQVSALLKTSINSLKVPSYPVAPEGCMLCPEPKRQTAEYKAVTFRCNIFLCANTESLSCLVQLKSSTEEANEDKGSAICLQPGNGDCHVFYPESQGDALLIEVQDINKVAQGRAAIPISSLTDHPSDRAQWWPIYHGDHECVGKVQLSISCFSTYSGTNTVKNGPVVETVVYDLVVEAALRAQNFQPRNLHIHGSWKWLLNEFASYYGVSDAYTKLRYVSYILNVATPTKDCLELLNELLSPVVKARSENSLNRQEKSLLLECEAQVDNLLGNVFENYKSLDELSPTGLIDTSYPTSEIAAPALLPAVQLYTLLHDILSQEGQSMLRKYLQVQMSALVQCVLAFILHSLVTDHVTISTAYQKLKALCLNIRSEIQADIKIHNQDILPSSIDLPNISASIYSTKLCKRLAAFLAACPPSRPSSHVTELLSATADFERDLHSWNINPVHGGVVSRDLFHDYIMVWIQETRLHLLDLCKAEKVAWSGVLTHYSTSPFVENMYDQIRGSLSEYEVVINRWPQYLIPLEVAVSDVERAVMKTLEKQYTDVLAPLRESIPQLLEKHVQKFTRRQSTSIYLVPDQLGTFLNTVKRMLDVLHGKVEQLLRSWESALTVVGDGKSVFGEQMNGITVMLRKKYKNYVQAIVEKLVRNTQASRAMRLKRILEETRDSEGEPEIRERMLPLCMQITDAIRNLHGCFSSRIFVTISRGLWDRLGQIVLSFLESRKENRIWYRASNHALAILEDLFASQMQMHQGNSLQEKDLDPPRSKSFILR